MDIFAIIEEPNPANKPNLIVTDYRQIRFVIEADTLCPPNQPMYADIYIDDTTGFLTYYKTITSYSIDNLGGTNSLFLFDIQDAGQEHFQIFIGSILNTMFEMADPPNTNFATGTCKVYFRGSDFVGGLLVPNPVIPVQATATTPAVPGTGTPCNDFVIIDSSLPVNYNTIYVNTPEDFLFNFKRVATSLTDTRVYPLSNLPLNPYASPNLNLAPKQYRNNYASFPVYILEFITSGILNRFTRNCELYLEYGTNGILGIGTVLLIPATALITPHIYNVPVGLANLKLLLSAGDYAFITNVNNNIYYRVSIWDADAGSWAFRSPLFAVATHAIEQENIWFRNLWGQFESISFVRSSTTTKNISSEQFTPYTQAIGIGLNDPLEVGRKRYNVRSNDEITLTAVFDEGIMEWVKELINSPYAFRQVDLVLVDSGFQAVKVVDGSLDIKKTALVAGVKYTVSLKIIPAVDFIQLRN